ncbi:MAG TPA: hypothetical protein VL295_04310, partial [Gemmatimonadales bacterium]|nr:hypothetical protein [Gemmatimonadales bacterium]
MATLRRMTMALRSPGMEGTEGALGKVLVVAPAANAGGGLGMLVRAEGYAVESAAGADEALAKLQADPTALVMLDALLPDAEGERLLGLLRKDAKLSGVTV